MPTLFSYCISVDDGAAPNPFWGVCTLVICKPTRRRKAEIGDWVVGTSSKNSPIGDISEQIVYAMRVSQKMTMREYDKYTERYLPNKIPNWLDGDEQRQVGDAIYAVSRSPPPIRPSVHGEKKRIRDLGGQFPLLSNYYFSFGRN